MTMKKVCATIGKYFGVMAVLFLILGMTFPDSFKWVLVKPAVFPSSVSC